MLQTIQKYTQGRTSVKIAEGLESAASAGRLAPGELLPPVRELAESLGVSPATAAAAYRKLQARGVLVADGRRGTRVARRPFALPPLRPACPPGALDLASGNPDPNLLPSFEGALRAIDPSQSLYSDRMNLPELAEIAARGFSESGVPKGPVGFVGGALDGIERVLRESLRPGDRVAVEDPGFSGITNLVAALGMSLVPVGVDDDGPLPQSLGRALKERPSALIITPRAQNPTGAALSSERARELRRMLAAAPDLLLIEDDHAGLVAGAPARTLAHKNRARWAVVHSYSKALGPDLRAAALTGDEVTMARVFNRQVLGMRWVSRLLQRVVIHLLSDRKTLAGLARARDEYARRREALIGALARRGVEARGASGLNVWIPVPDESAAIQAMRAKGFHVAGGESFRLVSPPAIRITVSNIKEALCASVAESLAAHLASAGRGALV